MRRAICTAATILAIASPAAAQDRCEPFEVVSDGSSRVLTFVDVPPEGPTIGDQRTGYRVLKDSDGQVVGEERWIQTYVHGAGEAGARSTDPVFSFLQDMAVFEGGAITSRALLTSGSGVQEQVDQVTARGDFIVTGGSGVFYGAYGEIRRQIDGMTIEMVFDINCP